MNAYRKQTTKGKGKTVYSKRFYGTLRTWDGKRKQVPLSEDREASKQLLCRLQTEEDRQRATGVDRYAKERLRPLPEHVDGYERYLRSKADTAKHVSLTMKRVRSLLDATQAKTISDLDAARMASTLWNVSRGLRHLWHVISVAWQL